MKNICYFIPIISLIFLLFNLLNGVLINRKEGLDNPCDKPELKNHPACQVQQSGAAHAKLRSTEYQADISGQCPNGVNPDTGYCLLKNTSNTPTTLSHLLTSSTSSGAQGSAPYPPIPILQPSNSTNCHIIGSESWNYLCKNGLASIDPECQTNCATTTGPGPKVCCTTPCCGPQPPQPQPPQPPPQPSKCFNKGSVQCGGSAFIKDKRYRCCSDGYTCTYQNKWYSECRVDD